MQNIKELRNMLIEAFEQTRAGTMDKGTSKQLANTAGKIIHTLRIELDYVVLSGKQKNIAFLVTGEEIEPKQSAISDANQMLDALAE